MKKVSIVYHEGIADYDFGPEYSVDGDRFPRYLRLLESEGLLKRDGVELVKPVVVFLFRVTISKRRNSHQIAYLCKMTA